MAFLDRRAFLLLSILKRLHLLLMLLLHLLQPVRLGRLLLLLLVFRLQRRQFLRVTRVDLRVLPCVTRGEIGRERGRDRSSDGRVGARRRRGGPRDLRTRAHDGRRP